MDSQQRRRTALHLTLSLFEISLIAEFFIGVALILKSHPLGDFILVITPFSTFLSFRFAIAFYQDLLGWCLSGLSLLTLVAVLSLPLLLQIDQISGMHMMAVIVSRIIVQCFLLGIYLATKPSLERRIQNEN